MSTKCMNCQKEKNTTEYRLSVGKDKYCNNQCKYEYAKKTERRKKHKCCNCWCDIFRSPSLVKSENMFCSIQCKWEWMTKWLTKPMRLWTGTTHLRAYREKKARNKFYKYRTIDKSRWYEIMDYKLDEFIDLMKTWQCIYCWTDKSIWLDRVDNHKWHTKDNTVLCCDICNMTRWNRFTVEQMIELWKVIKSFNL